MVEQSSIRSSKNRKYFVWRQFLQLKGKMFSHVFFFKLLTSKILFCRQHRCFVHALLVVNLKGTDVMYPCRILILFLFLFYFILFLEPHVHRCYDAEVIYHIFYLFWSSGMEYRTLSQMYCRLYLPIFLFRIGLFTLIYRDSFIGLAILCPSVLMILKLSTANMWLVVF